MDAGGNIYVTGYFKGAVDFDPGAGVVERANKLNEGDNFDSYVLKLDSQGSFQWVQTIDLWTERSTWWRSVAASVDGSVYMMGDFRNTAILPTGQVLHYHNNNASPEAFVHKLSISPGIQAEPHANLTTNESVRAPASTWF